MLRRFGSNGAGAASEISSRITEEGSAAREGVDADSAGDKMISVRLAVRAVLVAAALAGCFTYFIPPPPLVTVAPQLPEKMPELPTGIPANIDRPETPDQFLQAAQAILKQDPNAQASADKPTITGLIPLPKKRPILRP